jgi:hypothetical protein
VNATGETLKSLTSESKRIGVAVDANESEIWETLKKGLAVTTEAQSAINQHCPIGLKCWTKQLDASLQGYWRVQFVNLLGVLVYCHLVPVEPAARPPLIRRELGFRG